VPGCRLIRGSTAPLIAALLTLIVSSLGARPAAADPPAQPSIEQSAPAAQPSVRVDPSVRAGLQQRGAMPVIVQVRLPGIFRADGALDPTQRAAQRAAIRSAQSSLLTAAAGAANVKQFETIPFVGLTVDASTLTALTSSPAAVRVFRDELRSPTLFQSIPLIGANQIWQQGYTGAGWTVAVLDTGVDRNHEFFGVEGGGSKVVSEACYSTTNPGARISSFCPGNGAPSTATGSANDCPTSNSGCGHGTHVAGIVAGSVEEMHGVARDATIIAIQVFSKFELQADCGQLPAPCARTFTSDQIRALERVMELNQAGTYKVAAVNMSLGGGRYTSQTECDDEQAPIKAAIDNLRAAGIASIIASGNDSYPNAISAPACVSSAISVGSTTFANQVSSFSNAAPFLTMLAPGDRIMSSSPGNAYKLLEGTSMATPHVAGTWALFKQKAPGATIDQITNALVTTGVPVTDTRPGAGGLVKPRIALVPAIAAVTGGGLTATKSCTQAPNANAGSCQLTVTLGGATPAGQTIAVAMTGPATLTAAPSVATACGPATAARNSPTSFTVTLSAACAAGTQVLITEPIAANAAGTVTQTVAAGPGGSGTASATVSFTPAGPIAATKTCQSAGVNAATCLLNLTFAEAVPAGTTARVTMTGSASFSAAPAVVATGCRGPVQVMPAGPTSFDLRIPLGCNAGATLSVTEPLAVTAGGSVTQTVTTNNGWSVTASTTLP
jgi:subtilisin family serine protease